MVIAKTAEIIVNAQNNICQKMGPLKELL